MITIITITRRPHKVIPAKAHVMEQQKESALVVHLLFLLCLRLIIAVSLQFIQAWHWVKSLIRVSLISQSHPLYDISCYHYPSLEQWNSLGFTWFYLHLELDTCFFSPHSTLILDLLPYLLLSLVINISWPHTWDYFPPASNKDLDGVCLW